MQPGPIGGFLLMLRILGYIPTFKVRALPWGNIGSLSIFKRWMRQFFLQRAFTFSTSMCSIAAPVQPKWSLPKLFDPSHDNGYHFAVHGRYRSMYINSCASMWKAPFSEVLSSLWKKFVSSTVKLKWFRFSNEPYYFYHPLRLKK